MIMLPILKCLNGFPLTMSKLGLDVPTDGYLSYKDYLSNKRFNAQRHIDKIHGGGEPVDSRTGETRPEKGSSVACPQIFQYAIWLHDA